MRKFIILTLLAPLIWGCFDQSKYWDSAILSQDIKQQQEKIDDELKLLNKIKLPKEIDNQIYIDYSDHLKIITEQEKALRKDYKHLIKLIENQNPNTLIVKIIMLLGVVMLAVFLILMVFMLKRRV